jgi:hypothetical protein
MKPRGLGGSRGARRSPMFLPTTVVVVEVVVVVIIEPCEGIIDASVYFLFR